MAERIVSLIASATEIVCGLGLGNQLVGRSHECDHPEWVRKLPVVTEPKFRTDGRSYEIDQRVQAILEEALSVYRVDSEKLRELQPDLIVTQAQCAVCAVSLSDVEEALSDWLGARPQVVSLEPKTLDEVWGSFLEVAEPAGVLERGREWVRELRKRADSIRERARMIPRKPTVVVIEWIDPLMVAANWTPELIQRAGGEDLLGVSGRHSWRREWRELVAKDPDVILVIPCGWDIPRIREEMLLLESRPEWKSLRAVRNGKIFLADGNQYFNRPGPRLVESLEILAEIFHPETFSFGHRGKGWEPWREFPEKPS